MPVNSLYPAFIKMFYNGNNHPHVQVLPMFQADPAGASFNLKTKDGTILDWVVGITAYATAFKPNLNVGDEIVSAQLWGVPTVGGDPLFLADTALAIAGTGAGAAQALTQAIITYRTTAGGLYRWYLMEGVHAVNQIANPPFGGAVGTLDTYIRGATSIVVGRDGAYLSSAIRFITKENDALRRKFFLNA